ncbi:uncharacterized protein LOC114805253 [Zeugodacus cucurbitae]|uniref:uncharacterized protein LOC114805253 n=1 Tax=Zeugodacus cucurbitae TaxID=28588 RepID=UPI0023D95811|nr:uncharacterized protein LOC114805253 [Zeugodacus cucurbitae]
MGGREVQNSNKTCPITLNSPLADKRILAEAIVLPKLTNMLLSYQIKSKQLDKVSHLNLADPNCNTPAPIDILLGSDLMPQIILEGVEKISSTLLAQNTIFGWILSGPVTETVTTLTTQVVEISNEYLNTQLRKFWEEDQYCEDFYKATTTRSGNGRYVVRLPLKQQFPNTLTLGHSRTSAIQQFLSMEKNLLKKGELKPEYDGVLEEYLNLDHMEEVSPWEK